MSNAGAVLISAEYQADIAAVAADPIAIAMAAEIPAGQTLDSSAYLNALRVYQYRGGKHGTTHMGAVLAGLRQIRGE